MYFCDSLVREIFVCDYRAGGDVANVRSFARLADADGDPDGSIVDRDGGLWNAQWGGRRVVRYGRTVSRRIASRCRPRSRVARR